MKNIKINLTELGIRLGLVVAKYPDGRKGAEGIAKISPFTLDRWLAGKSPKMPLLPLAQICKGQNVSMNWLLYGDLYPIKLQGVDVVAEFGTKIFAWMERPDKCLNISYSINEILEHVLGIPKEAHSIGKYRDLALVLKGLGWKRKRISSRVPFSTTTTTKTMFIPPSWGKEKEPGNEE